MLIRVIIWRTSMAFYSFKFVKSSSFVESKKSGSNITLRLLFRIWWTWTKTKRNLLLCYLTETVTGWLKKPRQTNLQINFWANDHSPKQTGIFCNKEGWSSLKKLSDWLSVLLMIKNSMNELVYSLFSSYWIDISESELFLSILKNIFFNSDPVRTIQYQAQ